MMGIINVVNICKIDSSTVLCSTLAKVRHHLPKGLMELTSHARKQILWQISIVENKTIGFVKSLIITKHKTVGQ